MGTKRHVRGVAAVIIGALAFTTTVAQASDPLPSWHDTASTKAIVAFVEKVTKEGSPSQILKIGPQPISLQLGPKLYVEGPTSAPDWGLRFAFILLFPK